MWESAKSSLREVQTFASSALGSVRRAELSQSGQRIHGAPSSAGGSPGILRADDSTAFSSGSGVGEPFTLPISSSCLGSVGCDCFSRLLTSVSRTGSVGVLVSSGIRLPTCTFHSKVARGSFRGASHAGKDGRLEIRGSTSLSGAANRQCLAKCPMDTLVSYSKLSSKSVVL